MTTRRREAPGSWLRSLRLAATLALAIGAGPALAAPATPDALARALDTASRSGDADAGRQLITDDFRHAVPVDGDGMIEMLVRRRSGFALSGVRVEGRRAALTGASDGQPVVLLAERRGEGWQIDGIGNPDSARAWLTGQALRPAYHPDLARVGEMLSKALVAKDATGAHELMTEGFLDARRDGGRGMVDQFVRKGLKLDVVDARGEAGVGVVTADVLTADGRRVDRVWLLASSRPVVGWRFEAVTEDRQRVVSTLAGRVPVRFDARLLPAAPGPAAAAEAMRTALRNRKPDAAAGLLGTAPASSPGIGQPRARRWLRETAANVRSVSPPAVHAWVDGGRAVARIVVSLVADGQPSNETVWLYIGRDGAEWAVVDLSFGLSERWFHQPRRTAPTRSAAR